MEAGTEEKNEKQDEKEEEGQDGGQENGGNVGTVEEVQGVVLEVVFPDGLPEIYNALEIEMEGDDDDGEKHQLVCEVQQHLGDERIRAVAMDSTDGLARGM